MGPWTSCDGALNVQRNDRHSVYGRAFGNRFFIAAISLLLIAIAMNWLVERLDSELELAESAQFHLRVAELRSAVTLMQASLVAKGEVEGLAKYIGRNPMDWIEADARHYIGERNLKHDDVPPGSWVFDPDRQVIAYLPKSISVDSLLLGLGIDPSKLEDRKENESAWLRFKVVGLLSKDKGPLNTNKVIGLELKVVESSLSH